MIKIREKDVYNICIKENETNKLLDYDNNKSHFRNANLNEILSCFFSFVSRELKRAIRSSKMINEEYFISNIIKIYKKYVIGTDKEKEIIKVLNAYKEAIILLKVEVGFDENDKEEKAAEEILLNQVKQINDFFSELNLKEKMYQELGTFDKYLEQEELPKEEYDRLTEIINYAVYPVPQRYIDLYFRETVDKNILMGRETLKSVINSIIKNFAHTNDTHCYFKVLKESSRTKGSYEDKVIYVSPVVYKKILRNGKVDYKDVLLTVFHELRHLYQDNKIVGFKRLDYNDIEILMDLLISYTFELRYYDKNYDCLSYELDARVKSRIDTDRYLDILGKVGTARAHNLEDVKKNKTKYRKFNHRYLLLEEIFYGNIEKIFETAMSEDVNIFEKHPILNILFTPEIKRRSTAELFKMRNEFQKRLEFIDEEETERLEILIHNINEVLYGQILPLEDMVSDYKELLKADFINETEKKLYLENMRKLIEMESRERSIYDIDEMIFGTPKNNSFLSLILKSHKN